MADDVWIEVQVPQSMRDREKNLLAWLRSKGVDTVDLSKRLDNTKIVTKTCGPDRFLTAYTCCGAAYLNAIDGYGDMSSLEDSEYFELRAKQRRPDYFPLIWSRLEYILMRLEDDWATAAQVRRQCDNLVHFPRMLADSSFTSIVIFARSGYQVCDATIWSGLDTPYVTVDTLLELITHQNKNNKEIQSTRVRTHLADTIRGQCKIVHGFHTREKQPWVTFSGGRGRLMHLTVRQHTLTVQGVTPVRVGHLMLELCDKITIGNRENVTDSIIENELKNK